MNIKIIGIRELYYPDDGSDPIDLEEEFWKEVEKEKQDAIRIAESEAEIWKCFDEDNSPDVR